MSWGIADIPDQSGRTAVVTGANGGLGLATARALAGAGAHVVMAARNQAKAAEAEERITAGLPDASLSVVPLDLGSLNSVREAAEQIFAAHDSHPHLHGRYRPWRAYGQAKLANFHFGLGLHRLLADAGAPAGSLIAHPGLSNTELQAVSVEETDGGLSQRFFLGLARSTGMSPGQGALSQLRAATDPGARSGEFYGPLFVNSGPPVRKPILRRLGMSRAIDRLWQVSERETGLKLAV